MYPWLQWTYANAENATAFEIEQHVSGILDVYGYLTFAAPLLALVPELILTIFLLIKKGLITILCLTTADPDYNGSLNRFNLSKAECQKQGEQEQASDGHIDGYCNDLGYSYFRPDDVQSKLAFNSC